MEQINTLHSARHVQKQSLAIILKIARGGYILNPRKKIETMKQKFITIAGVQYPVQFDLDTIMLFEEIVEHSFFADEFKTLKSQMALTVAAALSADKDTNLSVDVMLGAKDMQAYTEAVTAYTIVMGMAGEFFKIPEVEPKDEKPENDSEDKPKN